MHALFSFADLKQTFRRLARERGFSTTVVLTLALCIGANVAIYAVVDAVLVRALPFPNADRLVTTINSYPGAGAERSSASLPNYYDRKEHIEAFASTSIYQGGSAIVGEAGSPRRIQRDRVSPEFFETLGVPLVMGRAFNDEEMLYANAQVLIITDSFWRNHFNADPEIVGREVTVDGLTNIVVGVLPPGFRFLNSRAQFFIPLASNMEDRGPDRRHSNGVQLIARLAPGATLATAQAQIDALNEEQIANDPYAGLLRDAKYHTNVYWLHDDVVREVRQLLVLLQAGVFALLLIGGVNLVNLLLIRATGRSKEFAVRQALGAGRVHLAREILLETFLLAMFGGLLGLGVGAAGVRLLATLGTDQLPLGAEIAFDFRLAAISLGGTALLGALLAVPIIVFNLRSRLAPVLQAETRGGTVSRAAQRLRHGFIVAQVAIAFALLTGAGMFGISLQKVLDTPPGFQTDHLLTASISMPWKSYPESEPRRVFLTRLLGELRAQPGVRYAAFGNGVPFSGGVSDNATTVEGVQRAPGESIRTHYTSSTMGDYWQALGISLVEGRFLDDGDDQREQRVCVVDQEFAQRYWPGESALGRRIASDPEFTEENATTIVGVVSTVKQKSLTSASELGAVYLPYQHRASQFVTVLVRTEMAPETMGATLEKVVLSLDPELPVDDIRVMQERLDDSLVVHRSPALLAAIFAGVALILAAVGTYGVLAYAVSQRRREIGVRMALGAMPKDVLAQFLSLGARLLLAGTVLGLAFAWVVGRAMQSVLFDVGAMHPGVLIATAVLMSVVVLLASLLPSRRASLVSPIEALRDD